jgi:SNF2 family DNA or RNA helicase
MTTLISHQTKSIVIRYHDKFPALFPHGTRFTWNNTDYYAVPHGREETTALRNMDYVVPAPIVEHYDFPSADGKRPFAKQVLTAASMTMHPFSYVLNGMGTGKTKAAIWAFHFLQREGLAMKMLVVAPLSTLEFTWAREIFNTLPHLRVKVLTGTATRRKKLLAEDADVYIVNHDGVKVLKHELFARFDIDVICFDEASAYRNARAERSKVARMLSRSRRYVWGMTGSPTPTAPTDAFGLAHLVTPATAPRSFMHFRADTMVQVSQFRWVPKKDAAETVSQYLQPGVRFSLDEIVELPPVIDREIVVPLGTRQKTVYDAIRDNAAAMLKDGTITAANGGVAFSKMLQASVGWVYGEDDDGRKTFPMYDPDKETNPRIAALLDIIESAERKIIVFSPFTNATRGISRALKDAGVDFAEVTGDTPHGERTKIFNPFQGGETLRVLNAHPECMSHGLTLTAADTIVWVGPVTKLETFEQANARIRRVGQAHKQQIIRMVGTAAERMVYRRLADRHELQENILDLLAELTSNN